MKPKIIIALAIFFLFLLKEEAKAFEDPVAGIALPLTAYEDQKTTRDLDEIDGYIEDYSLLFGIDSNLVRSVITVESNGQKRAINHNTNGTTDYGLMQINSFNHEWLSKELGITDFYNPRENIKAGCYMLGLLNSKYDNYHRVLMCYNMGEGRTKVLWNRGTQSSAYSRKVMDRYKEIN